MSDLTWLASLLKSRNTIDSKIAALIGRSTQVGNIGEYITAVILRIALQEYQISTFRRRKEIVSSF